jgi:hypothetical protein
MKFFHNLRRDSRLSSEYERDTYVDLRFEGRVDALYPIGREEDGSLEVFEALEEYCTKTPLVSYLAI